MKQRLGLAAALLRRPRLLVLDEPTNGLDPQGIHEVRSLFLELVAEGTTVFLSSHQLAEVELLCTRAAMMANGRLVAQDAVSSLLAPTGRVRLATPDGPLAEEVLALLAGPQVVRHSPGEHRADDPGVELVVQLDGLPPEQLNHELVSRGVRVRELVIERPTLEQVFLSLTGDGLQAKTAPAKPAKVETGEAETGEPPPLPPPPSVGVDAAPVPTPREVDDAAG
jgi:ABC-2 type transport system ATP-binding protein